MRRRRKRPEVHSDPHTESDPAGEAYGRATPESRWRLAKRELKWPLCADMKLTLVPLLCVAEHQYLALSKCGGLDRAAWYELLRLRDGLGLLQ